MQRDRKRKDRKKDKRENIHHCFECTKWTVLNGWKPTLRGNKIEKKKMHLFNAFKTVGEVWDRKKEKEKRRQREKEEEGNVLFNNALSTFYLWLYVNRHMTKDHSDTIEWKPTATTSWVTLSCAMDRIVHTTATVTPVVEHWLERDICQ